MDFLDQLARRILAYATVVDKQPLTPFTYRLSLQADAFKNCDYIPGQHLRLLVGFDRQSRLNEKLRTYSIWHYAPHDGIIDLAICTVSGSIGAQWVEQVKIGERVYLSGPKGKFIMDRSADYYILIGDLSALAHLYELHRAVPASKPVYSLVYGVRADYLFADLDGSTPLQWAGDATSTSQQLIEHIQAWPLPVHQSGIVYVGGESSVCLDLHAYFRQSLKWPLKSIKTKPFWHPLKKGLE